MKVESIAAVTLFALAVAVACAASPAIAGEPDEAELPGLFATIGSGTLRVLRGSHSEWAAKALSRDNAPERGEQVGVHEGAVAKGSAITIPVTPLVTGNGTYTVILALDEGGNDVWFGSSKSGVKPELTVTAEDPEAGRD